MERKCAWKSFLYISTSQQVRILWGHSWVYLWHTCWVCPGAAVSMVRRRSHPALLPLFLNSSPCFPEPMLALRKKKMNTVPGDPAFSGHLAFSPTPQWGAIFHTQNIEHTCTQVYKYTGLPWWLSGKESTCQCKRHRFDPCEGKIPWRRKW